MLFFVLGAFLLPLKPQLIRSGASYQFSVAEAALVPCGDGERDADGAVKEEDLCKISDLFVLVQNIINWLLLVMIPLAVLSIGVAGGMLIISGGKEESRSQAKEIFKYAIIGLVLALAAWLIVKALTGWFLKPANPDIVVPLEQSQ